MDVGQLELGVQASRASEDRRGGELGPVGEHVGADQLVLFLGRDGAFANRLEARKRIVELGGQRGEHRRHSIPQCAAFVGRAHRNRHRRDQGLVGEFADFAQVRPEGSGAHRQNQIIDRAAQRRLQALHLSERYLCEGDRAVWGDSRVERCARRVKEGRRRRWGIWLAMVFA